MLIEINNLAKARISERRVGQILRQGLVVLQEENRKGTISVAFLDEPRIKQLNHDYRRISQVTDVLTFGDLRQDEQGEILLCWPAIRRQAKYFRHSPQEELKFILIHGLLHLFGYDHRKGTDKKIMEKKAEEIEKKINN